MTTVRFRCILLVILLSTPAAPGAWTALHGATVEGNADMVTCLLTHGADIEARDEHGRTALHLATSMTSPTMATLTWWSCC